MGMKCKRDRPSDGSLKIYAMSDMHGHLKLYRPNDDADIVILAGDIAPSDIEEEDVLNWFNSNFKSWCEEWRDAVILILPGNHDRFLHEHYREVHLVKNAKFIVDRLVEVSGLKIYGTPWCKSKHLGKHLKAQIFETSEGVMAMMFENIPEGLDILVSHAPPYIAEDEKFNDERKCLGVLTERFKMMKRPPRFVICGHLHNNNKEMPVGVLRVGNSTIKVINVSRFVRDLKM